MSVIPKFYSHDYLGCVEDERILAGPAGIVTQLNDRISELCLKNQLVKAISAVALAILGAAAGVGLCYLALTVGSSLAIALGGIGLVSLAIAPWVGYSYANDYREESKKFFEIKAKIEGLPKDFLYLKKDSTVTELSPDAFKGIKKYLPIACASETQILLEVREQAHYTISGGEADSWSIQPVVLQSYEHENINNEGEVWKNSTSWIGLLLILEKSSLSQQVKENIGQAIGHRIQEPIEKSPIWFQLHHNLIKARQDNDLASAMFYDSKESAIIYRKGGQESLYKTAKEFAEILRTEYQVK